MIGSATWPGAPRLETGRLVLEPLRLEHADEMVEVLSAPQLYAFTGGEPPTREALRARYRRQAAGRSPANDAGWLNWIVRPRAAEASLAAPVGYVQATLTAAEAMGGDAPAGGLVADLAWLVAPHAQGGGVATEAAGAVLEWLLRQGAAEVRACILPGHHASERVARRLGLVPTATVVDGETRWRLPRTRRTLA